MTRKRILILIPNLGPGGAQKVFRDQVSLLAEEHEVWGCAFNHDFSFTSDLRNMSLDVPAGTNVIQKLYYFILRVYRLRALKARLRIDICISHLEGADYVNVLARSSGKVFCWVHGTKKFDQMIEGPVGWFRKKILIPLLYQRADLLVTVSDSIKEELIQSFGIAPKRLRVCLNGIDLKNIQNSVNEELPESFNALAGKFPVLITHCRFAPQKNVVALIEIFYRVKSSSTAKLVILGDGTLRTLILSTCEKLGLKIGGVWNDPNNDKYADIFFYGYQTNPYKFLSRATIYISTSLWEGYPLAICEALACGLPVIAPDCYTGPREILTPDDLYIDESITKPVSSNVGFLMPIPINDLRYDMWSETILKVISDSAWLSVHTDAARSRAYNFDLDTVAATWKKIVIENG